MNYKLYWKLFRAVFALAFNYATHLRLFFIDQNKPLIFLYVRL